MRKHVYNKNSPILESISIKIRHTSLRIKRNVWEVDNLTIKSKTEVKLITVLSLLKYIATFSSLKCIFKNYILFFYCQEIVEPVYIQAVTEGF